MFQPVRRRLGPRGIDAAFETAHDSRVPYRVKIFFFFVRIDYHAIAAAISVVRCMKRLMNVANKMNQECEIAGGSPTVVVFLLEAPRVLVDFTGNAVATRASRRNVAPLVLQTYVDVVPWSRPAVF